MFKKCPAREIIKESFEALISDELKEIIIKPPNLIMMGMGDKEDQHDMKTAEKVERVLYFNSKNT